MPRNGRCCKRLERSRRLVSKGKLLTAAMAANGSNLNSKQLSAIAALAKGNSHQATAKSVGVSHRQLSRWKCDPVFQAALRTAQWQVFDVAIAETLGAMSVATRSLKQICEDTEAPHAARVAAARALLDVGIKAFATNQLRDRIETLEGILNESSSPHKEAGSSRKASRRADGNLDNSKNH